MKNNNLYRNNSFNNINNNIQNLFEDKKEKKENIIPKYSHLKI